MTFRNEDDSFASLGFDNIFFLLFLLFLEFSNGFGRLVQFLVEQDVKVAARVIQEILHEATIEEVAVDVQLLVPINHVLVLESVSRVSDSPVFRLRWLVAISSPLLFQIGQRLRWQRGHRLIVKTANCLHFFQVPFNFLLVAL